MVSTNKPGGLPPGLCANTLSMSRLTRLRAGHLSMLFEHNQAGAIPLGGSRGKAIFLPGTIIGAWLSFIANLLWQGKIVEPSGSRLVNKILGLKLVRALVYRGTSWSDGKPAIVIDYLKTSLLAFFIRDEIRCVAPNLYLGKVYIRTPFKYRFCALWFALDFNPS